jgi:hypothetical protein
MAPVNLPNDFKEFLKLLHDHNVEYLLIGGYAVAYHGYPRATGDLDIWLNNSPQNAEKAVAALRDFGFDLPEVSPDLLSQEDRIFRMGLPPIRIELWTSISGVQFDKCYPSRVTDFLDDIEVTIINLEHLKANKKAAGRHKDLDDLENLA